jgi:hypothetical protein
MVDASSVESPSVARAVQRDRRGRHQASCEVVHSSGPDEPAA